MFLVLREASFEQEYFFGFSNESLNGGLVVVIDGQKCSWRMARLVIRHVTALIGDNLSNVIVVRPDAFWDKQHVENCAKTQKKGEVDMQSACIEYFIETKFLFPANYNTKKSFVQIF